ncbi:MAG: ATP-binding protein [Bacteroidales bacterium]|nr:ATP-binding protein [Bacteroidales bacterium]MBN2698705.1 ATP-binding protein [Bacteroidales bacterium]
MKGFARKYIQNLIDQGEHSQLDFKFEINEARKIARTLVAFANTDGGRLLIGVKDNGKISGIRSEEEFYMIQSAAQNFCKPEIAFETKSWNIDGKTVLEVYVPPADHKPFYAKDENGRWMAYHRVHDQNYLANSILLDLWKYRKQKRGILIKFTRNEELLLQYLSRNKNVTISKMIRDTGFKRALLKELLVKLIAFDVVTMNFDEGGTRFSLTEQPGEERL